MKLGKAPDFELEDVNGVRRKLSDYKGKFLVIYFYPKDMTPGCTKEACNLRDNYKKFKENKIEVLGISLDSKESHKKFAEKHFLPFPLLSDVNAEVSKKYGVYKKKKMYGKEFYGIERKTFVINPEGTIKFVIEDVNVENHAEQIFDLLNK